MEYYIVGIDYWLIVVQAISYIQKWILFLRETFMQLKLLKSTKWILSYAMQLSITTFNNYIHDGLYMRGALYNYSR